MRKSLYHRRASHDGCVQWQQAGGRAARAAERCRGAAAHLGRDGRRRRPGARRGHGGGVARPARGARGPGQGARARPRQLRARQSLAGGGDRRRGGAAPRSHHEPQGMSEDPAPAGATAGERPPALQGLMGALLDALRTRVELAGVELEIHLIGLARTLLWAVAAILCTLLALAFGVVALIAALWDSHRVLGLLAGGLTFLLLGAACAVIGARIFYRRPGILEDSVRQLDR